MVYFIFQKTFFYLLLIFFSIYSHLINKVYPGTIDTNLINVVKRVLHPSGVPRLILLALNAAIALGADSLKSLDALDWADPNKKVFSNIKIYFCCV